VTRAREAVGPAYLFVCLVAGGSAQGVWANMVLQLAGVAILAWAAAAPASPKLARPARHLFLIVLAALALIALQLVPLPASVWPSLGGRQALAAGYSVLGIPVPALPLSLAPYETFATLLTLIPPLAMLCAILRLQAYRGSWLVLAVLAGTFAGILLGILQVASAEPLNSPWYLFAETNWGTATGFFANANHMATLLVVSLPLLAALIAAARCGSVQRYTSLLAVGAGAALLILVGIALNGSLAGYLLALPVLAASALIVLPQRRGLQRAAIVLAGILLVGAVGALESSSIRPNGFSAEAATSVQSRDEMLKTTLAASRDFLPFGSGVGTFRRVYDLYENPDRTTRTYVVHAHNDYAELMLETGVPGIVLILLFLMWWGAAAWRAWRSPEAAPYARAASIASAAILAHSLVDFPLRTSAIASLFAMCLALLADRRAPMASSKSDLRPTRHVVVR
jgi:O-antigen ligase